MDNRYSKQINTLEDRIAVLEKENKIYRQKLDELSKTEKELLISQQQLQQIFDSSPAIMILINEQNEVLKINKTGIDFLGFEPNLNDRKKTGSLLNCLRTEQGEYICGQNPNCKSCTITKTIYRTINKRKNLQKIDTTLDVAINNKIKSYNVLLSTVLLNQWPDVNILLIIDDISAQKKAENELIESENRWHFSVDGSGLGLWDWNAVTNNVFFSTQWKKMLGFNEHEIEGSLEEWDKRVHPDDKEQVYADLNKHFEGKTELYQNEHRILCKDGTYLWVLDRGKVVSWTKDGKPERVIGTHTDISKRKIIDQELTESREQLEKSEALKKSILASIPTLVWAKDVNGVFIACNPEFELFYGAKESEIIGKTDFDFVNEELAQSFQRYDKEAILAGKPQINEEWITYPNGKDVKLETTKTPLISNNGQVFGVLGVAYDITTRSEREEAIKKDKLKAEGLSKEQSTLLSLFDKGEAVLFKWKNNENWKTDYVSKSVSKLIGYSVDDFISGKIDYRSCISEEDITDFNMEIDNIISKDITFYRHQPYCITTKTGEQKWVLNYTVTQKNFDNKIEYFIGYINDISEQKKSELQLFEAKENAERANRLKSEFLANMSHEIRTPLNAVLGYSEILDKELSEYPKYKPYIQGISKSGKNLISLINDILDLSKIEAGKLEIVPQNVNLLRILDDIKQIFAAKINAKQLEFRVNIDKRLPANLMLDHKRIRQILFNLVGNALKFTEKGFIEVSIKFDGDSKPNSKIDLHIKVQDTGLGIPQKQLVDIFEAFRQTRGQSSKFEGTGLGLSITKRLVEAMNGRISADSQLGVGSEFNIHLVGVAIPTLENTRSIVKKTSNQNISFKNPKILLVDDMPSNIEVLIQLLKMVNCQVDIATNGVEALEKIAEEIPDLVIMDIQMPILNGYEATKQIRANENTSKIPVIALTALALREQETQYGKVFNEYLRKPVKFEKLKVTLMKYLPYSGQKENTAGTNSNSEKESANIRISEKIMPELEKQVVPLLNELIDYFDTDNGFELVDRLKEIAISYNNSQLNDYAIHLHNSISGMQIGDINNLLHKLKKSIGK